MIVVADTGPIHYLILSGHIGLVHDLYGAVFLPPAVHRELLHPRTPPSVREWAQNLPRWADIRTPANASRFEELGPGEREAIALALEAHADFVLMDESLGRRAQAARKPPTGSRTDWVTEDRCQSGTTWECWIGRRRRPKDRNRAWRRRRLPAHRSRQSSPKQARMRLGGSSSSSPRTSGIRTPAPPMPGPCRSSFNGATREASGSAT